MNEEGEGLYQKVRIKDFYGTISCTTIGAIIGYRIGGILGAISGGIGGCILGEEIDIARKLRDIKEGVQELVELEEEDLEEKLGGCESRET